MKRNEHYICMLVCFGFGGIFVNINELPCEGIKCALNNFVLSFPVMYFLIIGIVHAIACIWGSQDKRLDEETMVAK